MNRMVSGTNVIRCEGGLAALEFTLVFPLMLILFLGTIEIARYALIQQKLDKTVATVADLATRAKRLSTADLEGITTAAEQIIAPFTLDQNGGLIFTSVSNYPNLQGACEGFKTTCISWQYKSAGAGASQIGAPGQAPKMPNNYPVKTEQNLIVAEIFFDYKPLLGITNRFISSIGPRNVYKTAMFKTRTSNLTYLEED